MLDAIDCAGEGEAYYFQNANFHYTITFDKSNIPSLVYSHLGAVVLRGENETAIARLIKNDENLQGYLERVIGTEKIHSYLEGRNLSGTAIGTIKKTMM